MLEVSDDDLAAERRERVDLDGIGRRTNERANWLAALGQAATDLAAESASSISVPLVGPASLASRESVGWTPNLCRAYRNRKLVAFSPKRRQR